MRATVLTLVAAVVLAGCGVLGAHQRHHVSAHRDETGTCEKLLPKKDAEALIGTELGDPQTVTLDNLSLCGWIQKDDRGRLGAGSLEATEWAKNLPSALDLVKHQYAGKFKPQQLRILERRLAQGLPTSNSEACAMFRDLIALEYPELEKGSDTVVSYFPDTKHPTAVTAQSCAGGEFRTISWLRESGIDPSEKLADKFLDAIAGLNTDSVRG